MSNIKITELWSYPIKSTKGISFTETRATRFGIAYDRIFALFDEESQVITARDYPSLLRLSPNITEKGIEFYLENKLAITIPKAVMGIDRYETPITKSVMIFTQPTSGKSVDPDLDVWFSNYLSKKCSLLMMGPQTKRPILEKYGGKQGQTVSYADVAPLLLISEASLADLNSRLEEPVTMQHFRPNIVVSGCEAFEEESWTSIQIGETIYDVCEPCKRCVFTTIDPITLEKRKDGEPLRTLAKYRKHPRGGGVSFGVLLAPRAEGKIKIDDSVIVK